MRPSYFYIFAIVLPDIFYLQGRFIDLIDPSFLLADMPGMIMNSLGLIDESVKIELCLFLVEIDSLLLFIVYFARLWLFFSRGLNP